jgi:hypothetical protein
MRSKRNGSRERPAPQEQQGAAKEPKAGPEGRAPPKGQGQGRKAGGVFCVSGSVCLGCAKALSQALSPPRRRSRALAAPCFPTLLLTSRCLL